MQAYAEEQPICHCVLLLAKVALRLGELDGGVDHVTLLVCMFQVECC
jgi:hypothetical protein